MQLWAPITKMDASTREIEGPISGPNNTDLDGQIVDTAWLRQAVLPWAGFGNIRQQHDPKKPVGKAVSVNMDTPDGVPVIRAKIVDDDAWKLITNGVLSGFSIGVKNPTIIHGTPNAPKGRIVGGNLVEVSVVDHPANMEAKFAICKAVGNDWIDCQTGDSLTGKSVHSHEHHELTDTQPGTVDNMCACCNKDKKQCTCPPGAGCCDCAGANGAGADMDDDQLTGKGAVPRTPQADASPAADFAAFERANAIHAAHQTSTDPTPPARGPEVFPEVNTDTDVHSIVRQIRALADRLDTRTAAGFSPNANPATVRSGNEPLTDTGFPPEVGHPSLDSTGWQGHQPLLSSKAADAGSPFDLSAEEIYKIAKEAAMDTFSALFGGNLTKAVTPDSTKAAFADTLKSFFAEEVASIEDRLAKVEGSGGVLKGVANAEIAFAVNKQFTLNAAERDVVDSHLNKALESTSEDDKLSMATQYIHQHVYGKA